MKHNIDLFKNSKKSKNILILHFFPKFDALCLRSWLKSAGSIVSSSFSFYMRTVRVVCVLVSRFAFDFVVLCSVCILTSRDFCKFYRHRVAADEMSFYAFGGILLCWQAEPSLAPLFAVASKFHVRTAVYNRGDSGASIFRTIAISSI